MIRLGGGGPAGTHSSAHVSKANFSDSGNLSPIMHVRGNYWELISFRTRPAFPFKSLNCRLAPLPR